MVAPKGRDSKVGGKIFVGFADSPISRVCNPQPRLKLVEVEERDRETKLAEYFSGIFSLNEAVVV